MNETRTTGWAGLVVFAGVMMLLIGSFTMIQGLAALVRPDYFVVGENDLLVFNYTTWGWTMLLLGAVVVIAGIGVLAGALWGRILGIIIAAVNAIGQLAFLAAFPVWSILVIALDVLAIYAIAAHGKELAMAEAEHEEKGRKVA